MRLTHIIAGAAAASVLAIAASAQSTNLRIQTHYAPETTSGKLAAQFVDDVQTMSNGEISIEMFYSSSVVGSVETFDAAATGILDCDMTGGAYQTGKNPAFQFVGDIMGGYDTPYQQLTWLYHGGGYDAAQELYNEYGMQLIGWWVYGQESMSSSEPIAGPEDLKDWKFRSPPGLETEIFANLGASPIVMDFTEIFTALETGIIDGADASTLANNVGLGIYDIAKHTTYPGFHSMSSDHLACSTSSWESLTEAQQEILTTAMDSLALKLMMLTIVANGEALTELPEKGVTIYDWSEEDRAKFRAAAVSRWDVWADKTPETEAMVESHKSFMDRIGLKAE